MPMAWLGAAALRLRKFDSAVAERVAAEAELMATSSRAAKLQVVAWASAIADSSDARQAWATWAGRSLIEGVDPWRAAF